MHADVHQEEMEQLNASLRCSHGLLRQATVLMAQVEHQQEVDAHTLALIQRLLLDSQQFRAEFHQVFQHLSTTGCLLPDD